jgi:type I restriction enzyme, S subunit
MRILKGVLPVGWVATTIGEIAHVTTGRTPPTAQLELFAGDFPFAKPGDLDRSSPLNGTETGVAAAAFEFIPRLPAGTVLVSCIGNLGKTAILAREGSCNQQINGVLPTPAALPEFIHSWARTLRPWLEENSSATTVSIINKGRFLRAPIALPPMNEQRRIVAKLEALQSRSRRARKALDAVPPLLEKLRQSILAAAFRGDLTKDWRAQNPNPEPASALLARIRTERRKKWEESELAKLNAKGEPPSDDRWKTKYKEPEPVHTAGLPELPEGWCWESLDNLTDAERGIPYGIVLTGEPVADGIATVRCGDIKGFDIALHGLKRVSRKTAEKFDRTQLRGGEVLITIRGTVGATAVATEQMVGMNISREVAMIPTLTGLIPRYLMFCLAGPEAQGRVMKQVKGAAQAGINLADLRTLPVPLAPRSEQLAVLSAIERHLAVCLALERSREYASESYAQLDRSLLAKAFRGALVLQDPNDEPADVMLERLHANDAPEPSRGRLRRTKAAE